VDLQLRTIFVEFADEIQCTALASMPSLTDVTLRNFALHPIDLGFFKSLTHLTRLDVWTSGFLPLARQLARCHLPHLTDITVRNWREWDGEEDDCVYMLPQLRTLTLHAYSRLCSLDYFRRGGHINHSLVSLTIINLTSHLPVSELVHLYSLQALESLVLRGLMPCAPTAQETAAFLHAMPALRTFVHGHG
jgi:hypothetical protein